MYEYIYSFDIYKYNYIGENLSASELSTFMENLDKNKDNTVDFEEFVTGVYAYVLENAVSTKATDAGYTPLAGGRAGEGVFGLPLLAGGGAENRDSTSTSSGFKDSCKDVNHDEEIEEEEEEEEMPSDLSHLSPDEQQRAIKKRAAFMLGLGTLLVVLISDPMVSVLSEIGKRTGISPFYISFIFAPLASNAAEVIASYNYALKKTSASITISMSALQGACVMNNTFVLGIIMFLISFKQLTWSYFAETLSILFVILCVGLMGLKKTHTIVDAFLILSLYPLSLLLVITLEAMGWN
jgi:hypothetical protein